MRRGPTGRLTVMMASSKQAQTLSLERLGDSSCTTVRAVFRGGHGRHDDSCNDGPLVPPPPKGHSQAAPPHKVG
eukprot:15443056-Alexandrium_andersonii.AAC.1